MKYILRMRATDTRARVPRTREKNYTETKEMKYGDGPGRWGLHQQPPRPGQGGKEGNEGTP